jgi:hypothetical protein
MLKDLCVPTYVQNSLVRLQKTTGIKSLSFLMFSRGFNRIIVVLDIYLVDRRKLDLRVISTSVRDIKTLITKRFRSDG